LKRPHNGARLAVSAALAALAACASGATNVQSALAACASNSAAHAQVYIPNARVTRVLGIRESRSGAHEGFIISASGRSFKVEDNVEITGRIPLHRGDAVSLLGQLECDDDVIHWTHHDPAGRHPAGYVKVNGATYE
jgi:hypothetical protein